MGKFKSNFVQAAKREQEREREQERLRKKHHVEDEGIVVVEKNNMVKFLIRNLARLIRIFATILLFTLATIGLLALVYPNVRIELLQVIQQIGMELHRMLQWKIWL